MVKGVAKVLPIAKIGEIAFLVCLLVAVIAGLAVSKLTADQNAWVGVALVILGAIIGLVTITEKEVTPFLIAAVALLVAGAGTFLALDFAVSGLGTAINGVVVNIARFVAPAAIILSVKGIYALAKAK